MPLSSSRLGQKLLSRPVGGVFYCNPLNGITFLCFRIAIVIMYIEILFIVRFFAV